MGQHNIVFTHKIKQYSFNIHVMDPRTHTCMHARTHMHIQVVQYMLPLFSLSSVLDRRLIVP